MKCILVVMNLSMPDIVYLAADRQFTKHINRIALEKGLLQEEDVTGEVDLNAATQFFSPIVASQGMLANELDNPYTSITCENGFIFVFKEYGEHLYIAVNGDSEEDEAFLQRKLLVLHRIIGFLYGPIVEKLRPDKQADRGKVWHKMTSLMNTWVRLYKEEQSFLLEAVERLHVGQSLNELCIHVLEMSLSKLRAAGDRYPIHALLTVNSKLLALYSSRNANELQSSDQLLIILMVQELYPSSQTPEYLTSTLPSPKPSPGFVAEGDVHPSADFTRVQDNAEEVKKETEGNIVDLEPDSLNPEAEVDPDIPGEPEKCPEVKEEGGDRLSSSEYGSPMSTPERSNTPEQVFTPMETGTPEAARIYGIPNSGEAEAKYHASTSTPIRTRVMSAPAAATSDPYVTPIEGTTPGKFVRKFKQRLSETKRSSSNSVEDDFYGSASPSIPGMSESSYQVVGSDFSDSRLLPPESQRIPVFLRTSSSVYSPHELHIIQVLPETVLVVITEIKSSLAGLLTRSLATLELIMRIANSPAKRSSENINGKLVVETLDINVKKICEIAKKFSQYGRTAVQVSSNTLPIKWDNLKKAGFLEHLDFCLGENMSPRLETCLSEVIKCLKHIFQVRFLSRSNIPHQRYLDTVNSIETTAEKKLRDYREYLSVKGQRNIAMTAYMEDFPGLVHFIYVDRTVDLLTAPSINATNGNLKDDTDPSQLLKKKIWEMVKNCQSYLQKGFISTMRREGDYYYTYFIWFEDPMGNPLRMLQPPKIDIDGTPVGILAGHFYRKLVRQCFPNVSLGAVHCFELMCMHVGVVPVQYVVNHCHNLAAKLWETSGELNSPISLL